MEDYKSKDKDYLAQYGTQNKPPTSFWDYIFPHKEKLEDGYYTK